MQATNLSPSSGPDEQALEAAQRQARLRQLAVQTERLLREGREALAESRRAREMMDQTVQQARARLQQARLAAPEAAAATTPPGSGPP